MHETISVYYKKTITGISFGILTPLLVSRRSYTEFNILVIFFTIFAINAIACKCYLTKPDENIWENSSFWLTTNAATASVMFECCTPGKNKII
jgi:hypothetical protein